MPYCPPPEQPGLNLCLNPFRLAQHQARATLTSYATGAYLYDQWYLQHDTGGTDVQGRIWQAGDGSEPVSYPAGASTFGQWKNASAGAAGILITQPIEAAGPNGLSTVALRGQVVTFRVLAIAGTGTPALKGRIAEWTGTANSATAKGEVASWASQVPTFNTTTRSSLGTGSVALNASTWTALTITGTVGASANNLLLSLWVEGLAAGASVYLALPSLTIGPPPAVWRPHPMDDLLCLRYYEKSQAVDLAPSSTTTPFGLRGYAGEAVAGSGTGFWRVSQPFRAEKRIAPAVTLYSASDGTAAAIRNVTADTNRTGCTATARTTGIILISADNTSANAIASGDNLLALWAADARL